MRTYRLVASALFPQFPYIFDTLRHVFDVLNKQNCLRCSSDEGKDMPHSFDTTKIRELGLASFKSLAEMFDDCIKCFQDKGLL